MQTHQDAPLIPISDFRFSDCCQIVDIELRLAIAAVDASWLALLSGSIARRKKIAIENTVSSTIFRHKNYINVTNMHCAGAENFMLHLRNSSLFYTQGGEYTFSFSSIFRSSSDTLITRFIIKKRNDQE